MMKSHSFLSTILGVLMCSVLTHQALVSNQPIHSFVHQDAKDWVLTDNGNMNAPTTLPSATHLEIRDGDLSSFSFISAPTQFVKTALTSYYGNLEYTLRYSACPACEYDDHVQHFRDDVVLFGDKYVLAYNIPDGKDMPTDAETTYKIPLHEKPAVGEWWVMENGRQDVAPTSQQFIDTLKSLQGVYIRWEYVGRPAALKADADSDKFRTLANNPGVVAEFGFAVLTAGFEPKQFSVDANSLLSHDSTDRPVFSPSGAGSYEVQLRVTDGCNEQTDTVNLEVSCNAIPEADAGEPQVVKNSCQSRKVVAHLDGSASSSGHPDAEITSYSWVFERVPDDSLLTNDDIEHADDAKSRFNPDVVGEYVLSLTVENCCGKATHMTTVTFQCDTPPVANAGDDLEITKGQAAVLDGSQTTAVDGDEVTYEWIFTAIPPKSNLEDRDIKSHNKAVATVFPDVVGRYHLQLTTSDCCSSSTDDVIIVVTCNDAPTANAGEDVHVTGLQEVDMDGSSSVDPDGDELNFVWTFASVPKDTKLTSEDIVGYNVNKATFMPDVFGLYDVRLAVSDCCSTSYSSKKVIVGCNDPPTAVLPDNFEVTGTYPFDDVTISGCDSSDVNDDEIYFTWHIVSQPEDSDITDDELWTENGDDCNVHFVPSKVGVYEILLSVSDFCTSNNATVSIRVGCNNSPRADAGDDMTAFHQCVTSRVNLDGSGSTDDEMDDIHYQWIFREKPGDSALTDSDLRESKKAYAYFVPDALGTYEVGLSVSDGCTTDRDFVRVQYICNASPVADAGVDFFVSGEFPWTGHVTMDGQQSSDPDGDKLSYNWRFSRLPEDSGLSSAAIRDPFLPAATFTPDVPGKYELELEVSDCCSTSVDHVEVTVQCGKSPNANAGNDQYLIQKCTMNQMIVQLDGGASFDEDSDSVDYKWTLVSKPDGSVVTDEAFGDRESAATTFLLNPRDRITEQDIYIIELAVSDSCNTATDHIMISFCCDDSPTANAGYDMSITENKPFPAVYLDGTGSGDPNSDAIHYEWTFINVPKESTLVDSSMFEAGTAKPFFWPDERGEYEVQLKVCDCCSCSVDRIKVFLTCEEPPIVDAGEDMVVEKSCADGNVVELDGFAKNGGGFYEYTWTFEQIPKDSMLLDLHIKDADHRKANFVPDVIGVYDVKLTVNDGCSTVSDTVSIVYTCESTPKANAGEDQTLVMNPPFEPVNIVGLGSGDDLGLQGYTWEFTELPAESKLTDDDIMKCTLASFGGVFTPDAPGCYQLRLSVEGCCNTVTDTVYVCIKCNEGPNADAGYDLEFYKGEQGITVNLDGAKSSDPNGDELEYTWRFNNIPAGSNLTDSDIFQGHTATPSFTPDFTGAFELQLIVSDGCSTDKDTVLVQYKCNQNPIADAGEDLYLTRICGEQQFLTVYGNRSADPDGDELTYSWDIIEVPQGSKVDNSFLWNPTDPNTSFFPDVFGHYVLKLTVADFCFSQSDTVTVSLECNSPPDVDAGSDQVISAFPYPQIKVDGSATSDPDGDEMAYEWSFVSVPPDSEITNNALVGSSTTKAVFIPDVGGVYILAFTAADCCNEVTSDVKITVNRKGCNGLPEVTAEEDHKITKLCDTNSNAVLKATINDPDKDDEIRVKWRFTSKPKESLVNNGAIVNQNKDIAHFQPDAIGEYKLQVVASDGCNAVSDEMVITYGCDESPIADAGEDQDITNNDFQIPKVVLDGQSSFDPEGDSLTYKWSIVNKAEGSCLTTVDCDGPTCNFLPDVRGCYEFELEVSDCCSSSTDRVKVCITCTSDMVADAGPDQDIKSCPPFPRAKFEGLDSSSPPNEKNLFYTWTFRSLPKDSALTDADITGSDTKTPHFTPDVMGVYEVEMNIHDGCSSSSDVVEVKVGCNGSPVADAGEDGRYVWSGLKGTKVGLDGSNSVDEDDDAITYHWSFGLKPAESTLSDTDILLQPGGKAAFWPDVVGVYDIELRVQDCCTSSRDTVKVTVVCDSIPEVDAGKDQHLTKGCLDTQVTLSGFATDPEDDDLTYEWKFTHIPPGSKLKDSDIAARTRTTAYFQPDVTGSFFEVSLFVNDGCSTISDRVKINFNCNDPPQADAGEDQTLVKGCDPTVVYLSSSNSNDPESDPLTHSWRFVSVPHNSVVDSSALVGADTMTPYFTADVTGIYELEVVVQDCCDIRCTCMRDRVMITVMCEGEAPVANAGEDQTVRWDEKEFPVIHIDGRDSYDPDGDRISYNWTLVSKPSVSKASDADIKGGADNDHVTFAPDVNGQYEFLLTLNDCCQTSTDTVVINVECDNPPITRAGADQTIRGVCKNSGAPVFLDGSGSYDPEDQTISCEWSFKCQPANSRLDAADIQEGSHLNAFFYADAFGVYVVELRCFDGCSTVADELVVDIGCNEAPVASTESASLTKECDNVVISLDGTGSYDEDEDDLTFQWTVLEKPGTSAISDSDINRADTSLAEVIPDVIGTYKFSLVVSDCCRSSESVATFTVDCSEQPVADAGKFQDVSWDGIEESAVTLDGTGSTDPDTDTLSYEWTVVDVPATSEVDTASLANADTATPSFVPDAFGTYSFELTVSDCCSTSSIQTIVTVSCGEGHQVSAGEDKKLDWVCGTNFDLRAEFEGATSEVSYDWSVVSFNNNDVPVVDAGCDYLGTAGEVVHLTEAVVADKDHDADLTYLWKVADAPYGSKITDSDISSRRNKVASFTPDVAGDYLLTLWVSDGTSHAWDNAVVRASSQVTTVPACEPAGNTGGSSSHSSAVGSGYSSIGDKLFEDWKTLSIAFAACACLCATLLVFLVVVYRKQIKQDLRSLMNRDSLASPGHRRFMGHGDGEDTIAIQNQSTKLLRV